MSIKSSQQNESFQMSLKQGGLTLVYCSNMLFPNMIWCYLPLQEQTMVVLHILWIFFLAIFLFVWGFGCSEIHCRCPAMVCFMKILSRWVEEVELLLPQANPLVCVLRQTSTCTHAAKVTLEVVFFINKEANNSNRSPLLLCMFSSQSIWISFRRCGKLVLLNSVNCKTAQWYTNTVRQKLISRKNSMCYTE